MTDRKAGDEERWFAAEGAAADTEAAAFEARLRSERRWYLGIGYLVFGLVALGGAVVALLLPSDRGAHVRNGIGILGIVGAGLVFQGVRVLMRGETKDDGVDPLDHRLR